ncbi:MAG: helix-turn-helix transcriptional regulator [Lachnospiraceae bacterium]|nr:helix-turn-helix transcriptional regulator [Lachnospiraceae bacterium]MDD3616151.1 helix-turn-helix transcriptional regulator [Lachnospiraceae bacterium]
MNKKIGKRVAAIRRQRGYTQEQLAEKMGMSVSAISRLENGNSMVSIEHLVELASILNVGIQDLLCDLFVYTEEDKSVTRELRVQLSRMSLLEKKHLIKYIQLMHEWPQ